MECPNIKNRDTLVQVSLWTILTTDSPIFTFFIRIVCISRVEVYCHDYGRSPYKLLFLVIFIRIIETEKLCKVCKFKDF